MNNKEIENNKVYHEGIRSDDYKGNIYRRFAMDLGVKFSTIRFMEIMYRDFCKNNSDVFDDIDKAEEIDRDYKINLNHGDREITYNQIALNYLVINNLSRQLLLKIPRGGGVNKLLAICFAND